MLVALGLLLKNHYFLIIVLSMIMAATTYFTTYYDIHINKVIRQLLIFVSFAFVVVALVGVWFKGHMDAATFSIVFGATEAFSGLIKIVEAIDLLRRKNKIGFAFLCDALIEVVLGVLMIIEKDETLVLHVNLIAADKIYEGTIKLIHIILHERKLEKTA